MKLTVANIQFDVLLGQVDQNRATAERLIRRAADQGARFICLPELFTTGYDFELIKAQEPDPVFSSEIIDWFGHIARSLDIHLIAGSIPEKKEGRFYNTSFLFDGQGSMVGKYSKIHLFPPMGEDAFFTPGRECPVFETNLATVGLSICYDLRFPAQFLDLAGKGAKIVFIPAQFPHPRLDHWRVLLRARAIENHFFVAGCNRIGRSGLSVFCGHSCIISPGGEVLAEGEEHEGLVMAEIDLEEIFESRKILTSEKK
ncbi:MAG: carbon-nitrogen family hydrolase [bacterium]